ncbi:hypothetical protein WJX79_007956 [Trebouxia sp. C0005]
MPKLLLDALAPAQRRAPETELIPTGCLLALEYTLAGCHRLKNLTRVLLAAEIPGFMPHAYSSSTASQTRPLAAAREPGRGQNLHW